MIKKDKEPLLRKDKKRDLKVPAMVKQSTVGHNDQKDNMKGQTGSRDPIGMTVRTLKNQDTIIEMEETQNSAMRKTMNQEGRIDPAKDTAEKTKKKIMLQDNAGQTEDIKIRRMIHLGHIDPDGKRMKTMNVDLNVQTDGMKGIMKTMSTDLKGQAEGKREMRMRTTEDIELAEEMRKKSQHTKDQPEDTIMIKMSHKEDKPGDNHTLQISEITID